MYSNKSENIWPTWGILYNHTHHITRSWRLIVASYNIYPCVLYYNLIILYWYDTIVDVVWSIRLSAIPIRCMCWIVCSMMLKKFEIYWSTFDFLITLLTAHPQYLWTDVPIFWHMKIKINFNKSEINYRPLDILDNGFCEI